MQNALRCGGRTQLEILESIYPELRRKPIARPMQPASDRSDRAAADIRCLLIGQARVADQLHHMLQTIGKAIHCGPHLLQMDVDELLGLT